MKNYAVKMLIFAFSIFIFSAENAVAQMCGKFWQTIIVQDQKGKPIETATVQFLPITKDETLGKQFTRSETDRSMFEIEYREGDRLTEFHKLVVSADGYKTAENEIKFFSCKRWRIILKLPKNDSAASPVWEFDTDVEIIPKDENDKDIDGIKVSVFKDGKVLKSKKSKFGSIGFTLKSGEYVLKLEKDGYQTEAVKVDLTKIVQVGVTVNLRIKQKKTVLK